MDNLNRHRSTMLALAGLLALSLTLSSCDTLKEKFIRKPKHEVQQFTPVLEPEVYPTPKTDPRIAYQGHYDLIKAWYRDLWDDIDDKGYGMHLHYVLSQVSDHIAKMEQLVDAPTRAKLVKLDGFLDYYKSSLDIPWQARSRSRIESDMIGFDRFLRDNLRADRIKGHFVKQMPPSVE
ncbi:MAG: hypothetical protein KGJ95_05510 [Candidatus Omnitrophica bacterium]|nr:hypothetical protein [Candidatus Omnitrophota bacterium]